MKYLLQMLFAEVTEDDSPEDEIDRLFSLLLQIEPPPTLVEDILASIAHLPLPQELHCMGLGDVEGLIIHNDQRQ